MFKWYFNAVHLLTFLLISFMKLHASDVEGKIPSYSVCLCTMQRSMIELIQTHPDALISHSVSFDLDVYAISIVFMPVLPHVFSLPLFQSASVIFVISTFPPFVFFSGFIAHSMASWPNMWFVTLNKRKLERLICSLMSWRLVIFFFFFSIDKTEN